MERRSGTTTIIQSRLPSSSTVTTITDVNIKHNLIISADIPYTPANKTAEEVKYHNNNINVNYINLTRDQILGICMALYDLAGPNSPYAALFEVNVNTDTRTKIDYTKYLSHHNIILLDADENKNIRAVGHEREGQDPSVDNWTVDIQNFGVEITQPYTMRMVNDAGKQYIIQFASPQFLAQMLTVFDLMGLDYSPYIGDLHVNGESRKIKDLVASRT